MTMRVDVPEDIQKAAKKQLKYLLQKFPPDTAVAIFVAPIGEADKDNWVFYISNAKRDGMIKVVSQFLGAEAH